ncbi:MAG: hypothetical protein MUD01_17270 [Chloroflexaceae bacterium]|jgi:hypothetical protein|nr:hypothetical protein [Chloroflexaceae bacterium]
MNHPQLLLERLDAIGQSLASTNRALALIGLGSVGVERERLDDYSDLDFFAIVEPGQKQNFLHNLNWLSNIMPVVYAFQNTVDGFKLLFADGVFCEFAVFEPQELSTIPFAEGRIVWKAPDVDDAIRLPVQQFHPRHDPTDEWLVGEALTCVYVGLCRERRGERLSAQRFIQHYAVDRVLELATRRSPMARRNADPFAPERRVEQRLPELAPLLPRFVQGYGANAQSALAMLEYLERHFVVNAALAVRIRELMR